MTEHTAKPSPGQAEARSTLLADQCYDFLRPLLIELHFLLDIGWCRPCSDLSLPWSSIGIPRTVSSPAHAPAGAKGLSRLLHSIRWPVTILAHFLWHTADQRVQTLAAQHDTPLLGCLG